jgi:hypothetical protein
MLLVSLDNILSLPELLGRRGEPFNGAVHVDLAVSRRRWCGRRLPAGKVCWPKCCRVIAPSRCHSRCYMRIGAISPSACACSWIGSSRFSGRYSPTETAVALTPSDQSRCESLGLVVARE